MGRPSGPSHPSPASLPSGAPLELSTFVGRLREVEELGALLPTVRLLTLTGAGGSGKTRLAAEVVRRRAAATPVAWVELAGLDDPALLPSHLAAALGVDVEPRDVAGLVALLGAAPLLLVLDNCEHLVDACAELVEGALRGCPELTVLATSREALGVRGERAWLVPPLSVPSEEAAWPGVAEAEAVRLFVERARELVSDFTLTEENAPAVAQICRRLDGIPLALELAAARVKVLTPAEIRDRLDGALELLAAGGRGVLPRHRTLRAAIDWSHELLRPGARRLLRRLAVFRGGFTLEAVEAVGPGEEDDEAVLELLTVLVDRSLVTVREHEGRARYRLLETVRQFAVERLEESGEAEEIRGRHAGHFAELAARAAPHLVGRGRPEWVARLLVELDNLREALHWTRRAAPGRHVAMVGDLWWFWYSTRHWDEAERWLADALELPEAAAEGRERAALLFGRGALAALRGQGPEALPALEEAERLATGAGDDELAAYALNYAGLAHAGEGSPLGRELCRRAEAWYRAHDDLYGLRLSLLLQGSLALARGDLDEAFRLNREGVEVARRFGLARELATSLQNLAAVHLTAGEHREAEALLREALALSRTDPSHFFASTGLLYLAEAVGHQGRPLDAARLLGAAEGAAETVGYRFFPLDRARLARALPAFQESAGAVVFEEARAAGRALPLDEALEGVERLPVSGEGADATSAAAPEGEETRGRETVRGEASTPGRAGAGRPPELEVRLLGAFEVRVRGEPVPAERWSYAKPRELLALLAARREGASRDRLAAELWPDSPPEALKNRFHVTLHHLRKALGEGGWIVLEDERYRIAPEVPVSVDARAFEEDARRALEGAGREGEGGAGVDGGGEGRAVARLRVAVAGYGGELLADEAVGPELEAWRDRLRALELELHLALARAWEASGDAPAALAAYGTAAGREPLSEEAHRGLMRLWADAGERGRALAHYGRVQELLRRRLDVLPDPETVALARSLGLDGEG